MGTKVGLRPAKPGAGTKAVNNSRLSGTFSTFEAVTPALLS
jgi:hypothetical protein